MLSVTILRHLFPAVKFKFTHRQRLLLAHRPTPTWPSPLFDVQQQTDRPTGSAGNDQSLKVDGQKASGRKGGRGWRKKDRQASAKSRKKARVLGGEGSVCSEQQQQQQQQQGETNGGWNQKLKKRRLLCLRLNLWDRTGMDDGRWSWSLWWCILSSKERTKEQRAMLVG